MPGPSGNFRREPMPSAVPRTQALEPGVPQAVAETPEHQDLVGVELDGKYRIDRLIGRGGMARVYRALHVPLRRHVAIKVLHPRLAENESAAARFDREAYSASRLKHPNCIQVTDFGTTAASMKYMVMELLEGHDLSRFLGEPLAPERAVQLMLQICRGLQHAHENGVVHRDLKPQNVFVTRDHEGRETLKIVDFGLAKLLFADSIDPTFTQYGTIFGTPMYMSPEQAVGMSDVDARADLYSAGVIFYYMLAGRPPFQARESLALLHQHVAGVVPPLPSRVPKRLRRVAETLLAKHRDNRIQTAREVLEALRPLPGRKPPPLPRPERADVLWPDGRDDGDMLSAALRRAALDPEVLRIDGSEVTPVPMEPPRSRPAPEPLGRLELARGPRRPVVVQQARAIRWPALGPFAVIAVLVALWSGRRLLLGDALDHVVVAGTALRPSVVTLGVWCIIGLVGWVFWSRSR